jgi:hypothetical protein
MLSGRPENRWEENVRRYRKEICIVLVQIPFECGIELSGFMKHAVI